MTNMPVESHSKEPMALAELATESSSLFGFFATVFGEEASGELLELIRSPDFLEALFDAGGRIDLDFLRRSKVKLQEELAAEFAALFLGPGGHISPHESVQKEGGSGHLWGPETSDVINFIEAAGYEYKNQYSGIPDHISVEFEFMKEIASKEAKAWQYEDFQNAAKYLDIERQFMRRHLAAWAILFCNKVVMRAEHPFYSEFAKVAAEFLESENQDIPRRLEIADRMKYN